MVTKMEWKIASRNVSISVYNPLSRQIVNYYNVLNVSFERQGGGGRGPILVDSTRGEYNRCRSSWFSFFFFFRTNNYFIRSEET